MHVSDFARALDSGRLIVTAEFLPPRGSDPDAVARSAAALPETLDAVIVPDNPYEILSSALSAALLVQRTGRARAVMTMTTRDRNRLALMSEALGAAALGVPAILCVTGNHQSLGICPSAASANDLDSIQCVRMLKGMILHGSGPDGSRIEPRPELHVGAVVEPGLRPMELNLLRMRKKIAAGADFLEQFGHGRERHLTALPSRRRLPAGVRRSAPPGRPPGSPHRRARCRRRRCGRRCAAPAPPRTRPRAPR